jgi:copper homeostasis protein
MNGFLFELCAESLQAAVAADRGGATRIELCERLNVGGVTPGKQLITETLKALSIPVHVLIRPRSGDFVYSAAEYDQMKQEVLWVKHAGAAGVALGVLQADRRIHVVLSRELTEMARPMKVTFHRAFDRAPDLGEALEAVISTGADCLLTSGRAPNVLIGAERLKRLVTQAGSRIQIMAGGGLKLASMIEVLERSGVRCLHGSLTRKAGENTDGSGAEVLEADVRTAVQLMNDHFAVK